VLVPDLNRVGGGRIALAVTVLRENAESEK